VFVHGTAGIGNNPELSDVDLKTGKRLVKVVERKTTAEAQVNAAASGPHILTG
jgi:hypothetical protein